MDWIRRSLDSSDDISLSSSSQESLASATRADDDASGCRSPAVSENGTYSDAARLSRDAKRTVSGRNTYTPNKSSSSTSTVSEVLKQRESARDHSSNILSRIKNGLAMPLGIFTQPPSRGAKEFDGTMKTEENWFVGMLPPKSAPMYLGGGLGSSEPTPRCLSDLETGYGFPQSLHSELASLNLSAPNSPLECPPPSHMGWPSPPATVPLAFPNFKKHFTSSSGRPASPVSLDSSGPSPLFSELDTQSIRAWSPATPADFHSPPNFSDRDRKRQASVGSIQINDNHAHRQVEGSKGKHPAPPLPFDTLIADISNDTPSVVEEPVVVENGDEWWGLQYTLELSRRDSRASDSSSSHTGEHSKSRESWAAIHQGTVSPIFEDAEYLSWKRWHDHLDRIDQRKRRRRTIAFREDSGKLASLFVDEIYATRAMELYEHTLTDAELLDALEWAEYASARRPDPYYPAKKHRLAWVLKNHRSLASLRELKPIPFPKP